MMRALAAWWRSDFDYTWIPEFLERRGLTTALRWVMCGSLLVLALCVGLLLASDQHPESAGYWLLAVIGVSALYAAVRWPMAPWPTEGWSLVFLVWLDLALSTVVLFGIRDATLAVPVSGVLFISGLYAMLLHSPRVIVVHLVFALAVAGFVTIRAMVADDADVPLLAAIGLVNCGLVVFPVALHATLQMLKRDAATSNYDPLTNLLNRRGLADNIYRVRAGTGSLLLTVVLDLDGLKQLNDGKGHDAGDVALRGLATRLVQAVPPGGLVGRLGGDEFAAIVLIDESGATTVIDRIRDVTVADDSGLSASAGVWIQPYRKDFRAHEMFHEVVKHADFAMYEAKRAGLGMVVHRG